MSHIIRVESLDPIPLAVVRRQARPADLARLVPEGCGLVWQVLRRDGIKGGRHVAIYWDDTIRVEVGAELLGPFSDAGEVVRSSTPAGLVASTTHFGPYDGLASAHDALHAWAREQRRSLAGPRWEMYGHWMPEWNDNPSAIRTEVYYLLADPIENAD